MTGSWLGSCAVIGCASEVAREGGGEENCESNRRGESDEPEKEKKKKTYHCQTEKGGFLWEEPSAPFHTGDGD